MVAPSSQCGRPGVAAQVDALIAEELARGDVDTTQLYHSIPPNIFDSLEVCFLAMILDFAHQVSFSPSRSQISPFLAQELERVSKGEALAAIDLERYTGQASVGTDIAEAEKALNNARIATMYQELRALDLNLIAVSGPNQWRLHNYVKETYAQIQEKKASDQAAEIIRIHAGRKDRQTQAGERLKLLESTWIESVGRTLQLELACRNSEADCSVLESQVNNLQKEIQALG